MASSRTCLISSSEDCTICIWDVIGWTITRRFDLQKCNLKFSTTHFLSFKLLLSNNFLSFLSVIEIAWLH